MPGHFQSLLFQLYVFLGLFIFACKVVALGRAFSRRLINATCKVTKPHHRIRVSQEMREDLKVWLSFLLDYNGSTVMLDSGAPIVGNIDWSVGRHHAIRWSIIIPCGPFWFLVPKIYRLHFILFFFFFFLSYWQTSCSFVPAYFWHSVNTHIWSSLLFIYCLEWSLLYQVLHICFKLMFTNGKIVVCKYTIRFYSGLCFCQTHIWTSIFLFYFFLLPRIVHWMSGVTRVENDLLFC